MGKIIAVYQNLEIECQFDDTSDTANWQNALCGLRSLLSIIIINNKKITKLYKKLIIIFSIPCKGVDTRGPWLWRGRPGLHQLFQTKATNHHNQRRRIKAEEKAKVVASVWGEELIQFLATLAVLPRTILKNSSFSVNSSYYSKSSYRQNS